MKLLSSFLILLLSINPLFAQRAYTVACKEFTLDYKKFEKGKKIKSVFESALTNPKFPFKVVEREKLDQILEEIQNEKNLQTDFGKKSVLTEIKGVDYIIEGNIVKDALSEKSTLFINFIQISGNEATLKLPLIIEVKNAEFGDEFLLEKVFSEKIYNFSNEHFNFNFKNNPQSFSELIKKDSIIHNLDSISNSLIEANKKNTLTIDNLFKIITLLETENTRKTAELDRLKTNVEDIKDYTFYAYRDMFGRDYVGSGSIIIPESELTLLTKKLMLINGNMIQLINSDSTSYYTNLVLEKYPKFPFIYWIKAKQLLHNGDMNCLKYAKEAERIFKITTSIEGHKTIHNDFLDDTKSLIEQIRKINN